MWVIPSRPGSFILKDITSYLLINNSVPLHMSENTNTMGLHTTYLWVHTYWTNLIEQGLPQRKGHFSFSMPKRHRKCIIGACWPIYGPGVKSRYTINDKAGPTCYLACSVHFTALPKDTENIDTFFRTWIKQGWMPLLSNTVIEILASAIRQEKEIKSVRLCCPIQ